MKKGLCLTGVICIFALLAGCNTAPLKNFTINGEYIAIESASPEADAESESDSSTDVAEAESASDSSEEAVEAVDLSTAKITVTQTTTNTNGEDETVELASGSFVDGVVTITGEIREATEVNISVADNDDANLSTTALLMPEGEAVSFALFDYKDEYPSDTLSLIGASNRSQDEDTKFTVSGDLSNGPKDMTYGTVRVASQSMVDGEMALVTHGSVALKAGSFTIEADVDEPTVVNVYVQAYDPSMSFYKGTMAVVEPGSSVSLAWVKDSESILAGSDNDRHMNIFESWQKSEDYLTTLVAFDVAYAEYLEEWNAEREAQASESEEASDSTDSDEATDEAEEVAAVAEEEEPPEPKGLTEEQLAAYPDRAEGCEHVVIDQEIRTVSDMMSSGGEDEPEWRKLSNKMEAIKSEALQTLAKNAEDPFDSLLAMEAGAYMPWFENRSEAVEIYGRLESMLDEDLVARRVVPRRDELVLQIETEENDMSLVQGQKAPEFTLADLSGAEVSLEGVLQEKELVLVDFWASWCGPCIATFPELKRMHAAYNDDGFEIVAISIDSTDEDWVTASEEHEIPWVNLGEIEGWDGPTAAAYGVQFIPKGYLLDSEGCIIKKDLHTDKLDELLVARYGEAPLPEATEEDSESESVDAATDEMGG